MLRERPDLAPEYFRVVRAGSIQSGVGSAVTPKIMIRVRGPSDDPADDELLESKKIGDLGGSELPEDADGSIQRSASSTEANSSAG